MSYSSWCDREQRRTIISLAIFPGGLAVLALLIALANIIWPKQHYNPCAMYDLVGRHEIIVQAGPVNHVLVNDNSCPSGIRWVPLPK